MYLSELRLHWRSLAAAAVGLSIGHSLNMYIASIFSPHLIAEFGWTKPQFALLGVTILLAIVGMPLVGRLVDIFGVRRIASVGIVGMPLVYLGFSLSFDAFWYFFAVTLLQVAFVGTTTTSTVYTRLIAERFNRARGLALSIIAVTPAAVVAVVAPFLGGFIDSFGWRAGYVALAVASGVGGIVTLALIPRDALERRKPNDRRGTTRAAYAAILRNRSFRMILIGITLCNLTMIAFSSQLKLILLDKRMESDDATAMISLLAIGVMLGRLTSGIALDRFPAHLVAALVLGMPALGLALLGSGLTSPALIAAAVLLVGFATGAELDVAAYLVMKHFAIEVYSTAFGILAAAMAIAAASGSMILSASLHLTGTFDAFLLISAASTLAGSILFLFLGRVPRREAMAGQPV